jgi:hypothetical protein
MAILLGAVCLIGKPAGLWSAPDPDLRPQKKDRPDLGKDGAFSPVEIEKELTEDDPKDAKLDHPAKEFSVRMQKDKTYVIDLVSGDFDAYLRLLDKGGKQLAEDDDSGGNLNSKIIWSASDGGEHKIVVTSFDGKVGKFSLKVREFQLKGEKKPRPVAKEGLKVTDQIGNQDAIDLGKLGKVFTVELKAGQNYTIDLESEDLDPYLYLFDGKLKMLAQDDDGGNNLNSRIVFRPEQDGVYHLVASSFGGNETGEFTLKVSKE